MTDRDSLELHLGRWLLWGLLAVVALIALVIFLANLGGEDIPATPEGVAQVEWAIVTSEYLSAPGTVTLKGDEPAGFPTETWKDDRMLARSVDARQFEWDMDLDPPLPVPVHEFDQAADCTEVEALLQEWADELASAPGEAQRTQAEAFFQHGADTAQDRDCDIDPQSLVDG